MCLDRLVAGNQSVVGMIAGAVLLALERVSNWHLARLRGGAEINAEFLQAAQAHLT